MVWKQPKTLKKGYATKLKTSFYNRKIHPNEYSNRLICSISYYIKKLTLLRIFAGNVTDY